MEGIDVDLLILPIKVKVLHFFSVLQYALHTDGQGMTIVTAMPSKVPLFVESLINSDKRDTQQRF